MNPIKSWKPLSKLVLLMITLIATANAYAQSTTPVLLASMGNFSSGSKVPIEEIKDQKGLMLFQKDGKQTTFKILSYTVIMDNSKGSPISVESKGPSIPEEAKSKMQFLAHDRIISFENIWAQDENGTKRKIPSIFYIVN